MDRRRFIQAGGAGVALSAPVRSQAQPGGASDDAAASVGVPPLLKTSGRRAPGGKAPGREILSLDRAWRFREATLPQPHPHGHEESYSDGKAGNATGAAAVDDDDEDWDLVDLPHDFAVSQPPRPEDNLSQGYRRRGVGWYRRTFALDPDDRDRHLELQFDGVATVATVWLNGDLIHRSFSAYTGFSLDISALAQFGEDLNTLVVRADADPIEGWWYEGAGIYRHVRLVKRDRTHIVTDGLSAAPRREADGVWVVPVRAEIAGVAQADAPLQLVATLRGPDGRLCASGVASTQVLADGAAFAAIRLAPPAPALWSPQAPTLYALQVELRRDGGVLDAVDGRVGFRTLDFHPDRGASLNDAPIKLKGACVHQDLAGVGVAAPDALWDLRVRQLKAMGANAVRCAHNPPAAEFLDACDRLGLMVMDETRHFSASDEALNQVAAMVRRDRNHPSVILWSIANEESLAGTERGDRIARRMAAAVKALDDSRPVTAAMNGGMFASPGMADAIDVVGFNYLIDDYDRFHSLHPDRPMLSSEDTAAYMTRGVFQTDLPTHVIAAYDDADGHPAWGSSHREAWKAIATRPFIAGGFMWTGFDYRGEPSPFEWPTVGSSFGAMDLCGFPKTAFHIRRALWIETEPVLAIAPHWTWPGREGRPVKVMALTNCDHVRLTLNGKEVASGPVDPFEMAAFEIAYAPGRLEALGYRGGRPVIHAAVETAGAPAALRLEPDRAWLAGDGLDAQPVTVSAVDARGRACPTADAPVRFAVEGLEVIGVGNGDPNSHEPDKASARRLFNGLAQAIVRAPAGGRGTGLLHATAPGLSPATLRLDVRAGAAPPELSPGADAQPITEWRQSPTGAIRPDPQAKLADDDMNSWGWAKPGSTLPASVPGRWTLMRVAFTPRASVRRGGGRLVFGQLAGKAEIWIDGRLAATKPDPAPAAFAVPLPPGDGERTIAVMFDAPSGVFGIAGSVRVEPNFVGRRLVQGVSA